MHRAVFFVLALTVAAAAAAVAVAATQSPKKLRTQIFNTARKQRSVHYDERAVGPGLTQQMTSDVAGKRGVQKITFTLGKKKGRFIVRVVNKTAYLRGDSEALHAYFGFTTAQAGTYKSRWIAVRKGQPKYNDLAASVTLPSFLHDIYPSTPLVLVGTTINGHKVTGVRGVNRQGGGVEFVEDVYPDKQLRPFGVHDIEPTKGFVDSFKLSRWNEAVHVAMPANAVPITTVLG
jgi:hypothetical protein